MLVGLDRDVEWVCSIAFYRLYQHGNGMVFFEFTRACRPCWTVCDVTTASPSILSVSPLHVSRLRHVVRWFDILDVQHRQREVIALVTWPTTRRHPCSEPLHLL